MDERGARRAGIIGAYQVDAAGMAVATLPLAGMALAEHQARRLAALDVAPILLLGARADAALADIVAAMRRDGIAATLVEELAEAVERVPLDHDVLLLADGCLPDPALLARCVVAVAPAVAVVDDVAGRDAYERIDAHVRWAGIALVDARLLAETAAMLGGWDPLSTLMRRAVQAGAARVESATPPPIAGEIGDLDAAERALLATTRLPSGDGIERWVLLPIEDAVMPLLLRRRIEPLAIAVGAALLGIVAAGAAWAGWLWAALPALLLAGTAGDVAARLARIQARVLPYRPAFPAIALAAGAVAVLGLGATLMRASGQWGWLLLAALLLAALAARVEDGGAAIFWIARPRTVAWVMPPFAILGLWGAGLAALTLWACLSFAAGQRARTRAARGDQRSPTGM